MMQDVTHKQAEHFKLRPEQQPALFRKWLEEISQCLKYMGARSGEQTLREEGRATFRKE